MTLRRVFAGVVIGVAFGVLLGLLMRSVGWVRSVLEPWLTFLRALPPLAYFFLLVIWLGIDEAPKITLLALAALPPAAVATTAARARDRKSTRLNSSHPSISYAVFCLKKKIATQ